MNLKIKQGKEHIFLPGTRLKNLTGDLIINLNEKWNYEGFTIKRNHLIIQLNGGTIDLVFTGEVPIVTLENYEKDQIIFNLRKG